MGVRDAGEVTLRDVEEVRSRDPVWDGVAEWVGEPVTVGRKVGLGLRERVRAELALADCDAELPVEEDDGVGENPLKEGLGVRLTVRVREGVGDRHGVWEVEPPAVEVRVRLSEGLDVRVAVVRETDREGEGV